MTERKHHKEKRLISVSNHIFSVLLLRLLPLWLPWMKRKCWFQPDGDQVRSHESLWGSNRRQMMIARLFRSVTFRPCLGAGWWLLVMIFLPIEKFKITQSSIWDRLKSQRCSVDGGQKVGFMRCWSWKSPPRSLNPEIPTLLSIHFGESRSTSFLFSEIQLVMRYYGIRMRGKEETNINIWKKCAEQIERKKRMRDEIEKAK